MWVRPLLVSVLSTVATTSRLFAALLKPSQLFSILLTTLFSILLTTLFNRSSLFISSHLSSVLFTSPLPGSSQLFSALFNDSHLCPPLLNSFRLFIYYTQRSFYTQKLLHTEVFAQRSFYTQKLLHSKFLHREACMQQVFTQRSFYTQKLSQTESIAQSNFYSEKLSHREPVTQRSFCTERAFTQRGFYTEKPLHRESFYTD